VTDETDPVEFVELVLRRVLKKEDRINFSLPLPVDRLAFRPTKDDIDGISVFRELFCTPQQIADTGTNSLGYYVCRLRVSDILGLGLNVIPDPQQDQLSGHALIPELSYPNMKADKKKSKEFQFELAKLASLDICYSPD